MGKLTLMHQSVAIVWIRRRFMEPEKSKKGDNGRMYYQYKSLDEIKRKIATGELVS